ncbi:MAG: FHA domain-containing protein, partial [Myxococcota bacterium]
EVLAYTRMRGIARADLGVWLQALQTEQYDGPGKVRTMAWIAFEGMLPLGTDFMPILVAGVEAIPLEELGSNALFARLARIAPGTTLEDKRSYLLGVLHGVTPWVQGVVSRRGLTQEAISAQVAKWLTAVAGGTPAMGLAADALTDYFAHTGVQTVATVAIEQVWRTLRPPAHGDGKQAWTSLPLDPTGDSGHCEEGQGVAVGRDPTPGVNHIVLDAPMVSHQHLIAFAQEDGSWWVRDLGSTNGTSLNLPQRSRFTEARVTTDDVLYLGSYRLPVAQLSEGLHHSTSTASDHAVQAGGSGASEGPDVPEDPGHSTGDNAVRLAPEEADKPNEAMARCERAWMQIICLAALADDDLAGDEKETLLQVASTFPTLLDTPRRWVVRRLRRTIQAIRKQGFTAVVQQAIDALPQQEQRREALRLAALTTRADGQVHTSETRFMTLLAEALELSKADLEVAIEEADAEPTQEMAIPTFEDPPDGVSDS